MLLHLNSSMRKRPGAFAPSYVLLVICPTTMVACKQRIVAIGLPRRSIAAILTAFVLLLTQAASAADKVVLQLRWYHDFQFAGYYAALWQGYYAEAGLDVEIRDAFANDGKYSSAVREVAEGRAEFGIAGSDLLIGRDDGVPFTVLAPVFQESPITIFAKGETRLTSPADLKRLNLGMFTRGNVAEAEAHAMLKEAGLDPKKDFPRVTVTRRRLIDVIEGRVDAAVGYTTDLNWFEKEMGAKASQLKPSNFGVDFYGDSLFTRRALIEQAPQLAKAFREASLKGWRYALTHSNEVADRIARDLPHRRSIDDPAAFIRSQIEPVTRLTHFPVVALGHNDLERWRRVHTALRRLAWSREVRRRKILFTIRCARTGVTDGR